MLHNCVEDVMRSLLDTTESVGGFDADTVVVEREHIKYTVPNQASEEGSETGGANDQ